MPEKTPKTRNPGVSNSDPSEIPTTDQPKVPTPDERNAMRVYLQRAEVRLSTMHRVAGIFLNGAGLLILFPLLFKDVVQNIMIILATKTTFTMASAYYVFLVVPFVISLAVPLRSLYLLLKDLVDFYFAGNFPGYNSPTPRFVVPASVFPPDEAPSFKDEVLKIQYSDDGHGPGLRRFVLPFDEEAIEYYDTVIKKYSTEIIPETRTMQSLGKKGVISSSAEPEQENSLQEKKRFSAIFGFGGAYDRNLVEEVAFTEVMLARHASSLRRLVLRYAKSLLVVTWTILASFFIVALVHAIEYKLPEDKQLSYWAIVIGPNLTMSFVAVLYMVWAWVTSILVKRPIQWILEMTHLKDFGMVGTKDFSNFTVKDAQLKKFEEEVERWVQVAIGTAIVFLGFHFWFWFGP